MESCTVCSLSFKNSVCFSGEAHAFSSWTMHAECTRLGPHVYAFARGVHAFCTWTTRGLLAERTCLGPYADVFYTCFTLGSHAHRVSHVKRIIPFL